MYGDKAYISAEVAAALLERSRVRLISERRRNQHAHLPEEVQARITAGRQIVETVNEQLATQFHIERNHAHTFWGLCARLYSKLMAHTLYI